MSNDGIVAPTASEPKPQKRGTLLKSVKVGRFAEQVGPNRPPPERNATER
jgi:hypothetical protein